VPGEHFGEIGVIYECPRTATVISEGYSTFAQLPKENYDKIRGEFPELDVEMRSFILQMYNDDPAK
jgi:CRP-like cAMP-binding protein